MKPYSLDLRQKIVEAYDRGEGSVRDLAERFNVAPNTVQNYLTRRRCTGSVTSSPHRGGRVRQITASHERALMALLREKNDRTDAEYARLLARRTGLRVSRTVINRTWRRLGVTRKRKALRASEQDRPDVQRARRAFRRRARRARRRRFLFVDEFGVNLGMTRRYARARRGQRAVGKAPVNADPNVTLTMALSPRKVVAPVAFRGATNKKRFLRYLRRYLSPRLRPGDVVVLDRLSAHLAARARAIVEARGAELWLLPPYSPDLTPVEEAGAKVKTFVRGHEPRELEDLYDALDDAIGTITSKDVRGWFADRAHYLTERPTRERAPL